MYRAENMFNFRKELDESEKLEHPQNSEDKQEANIHMLVREEVYQ